jgi:hypothetical protein
MSWPLGPRISVCRSGGRRSFLHQSHATDRLPDAFAADVKKVDCPARGAYAGPTFHLEQTDGQIRGPETSSQCAIAARHGLLHRQRSGEVEHCTSNRGHG